MKLVSEEQILDEGIRAQLIKQMQAPSNLARKKEAIKRAEVYEDNTVKYVMLKLRREGLLDETLKLMENRASNISICKKIINKLARVYSGVVTRETGSSTVDSQISELARYMNFNRNQKEGDRATRLHKNALFWFAPEPVGDGTFRLCAKIYNPSQYDVIKNASNPTEPLAIVFSDFSDDRGSDLPIGGNPQVTHLEGAQAARNAGVNSISNEAAQTYIFWTGKYHFTTDAKGKYIGVGSVTPADLANPIQMIPGVTSSENQGGDYWGKGGQDIVDGSILINTQITDMNAITFIQGWGQFVITGGESLPDKFVMGPHHALIMRYKAQKDEPEPKVYVVNANPPLDSWMKQVEQTTALLLSTNNLSVSNVKLKLDVSNFPSGIALLVDKSESTENIEDNQNDFYWIEMREWEIVKRWHNLFYDKKLLTKDFADIGRIPEETKVSIKFENKSGEVLTETEKLANLEKRRDIGLATDLDLIMADNPSMTKEQAEAKLAEIKKEKAANAPKETNPKADPFDDKEDEGEVNA